jgi:hypothetical protein
LNFGRKGGKEDRCLSDKSCLEQGVSRPNGCFELSYLGWGSGDWYVRQPKSDFWRLPMCKSALKT